MIRILTVLVLFALWFASTTDQSTISQLLFPSPMRVLESFRRNIVSYCGFTITTLYRVYLGCLLGGVLGVGVAFMAHRYRLIEVIIDPIVELLRPIPPIALTPFFILWFGLGDFGQIAIVSMGCFMIIFVSMSVSLKNVNPSYLQAAKAIGASDFTVYERVLWPAVQPELFAAIRISLASSFGLTIAAEYLGAQGGLGFLIRNARTTLNTDAILAAVILIGASAYVSDLVLRKLYHFVTRWKE